MALSPEMVEPPMGVGGGFQPRDAGGGGYFRPPGKGSTQVELLGPIIHEKSRKCRRFFGLGD